ncbi:unnamed protein product [Aphis gossypii]|uniref:Transmembrane protein n=1 Tax=Aphis gossypii TaxID=80765 RepID=A0A9P0NKD6_APHGO|nr:unnamed protein product [Aphis gossypii]
MSSVHDFRPHPSVQPSSRMWRPPSPTSAINNAAPTPVANRQPVLFVRLSYVGRSIFVICARFTSWFFLFDGFIFRPRFGFPRVFAVRVVVTAHRPSLFASPVVTRLCQRAMFFVCDRILYDNVRPVRHSVMPLLLIIYFVFVSCIAP